MESPRDGAPMRRLGGAILDFGGVMTEPVFRLAEGIDPTLAGLVVFFLREANAVYADTETEHDIHRLETGRMSDVDFFTRLCDRYAAAGNPRLDPQTARHAVIGRGITASAAMVDAVRHLRRAGVSTALLTNNAREWAPAWRPVLPLDELFDVVVDSSEVGLRKPDPAIYLLTCRRLDLSPEDCLFVDDLECNVEAAAALGMETILCDDPMRAAATLIERISHHAA